MLQKTAITQTNIHDLMAKRWSPRAFAADKPVSDSELLALFEAARWSPSCFNDQPWRFIMCNKFDDDRAWQQALSVINEKNQRWAKNAPVLILVTAMTHFNHNGSPNRHALYDTGAACMSLCLQAAALGLSTHQMGGFSIEQAISVFNLPEQCQPISMLALGYQADASLLDDDFQASELAPRSRQALNAQVFAKHWQQPAFD